MSASVPVVSNERLGLRAGALALMAAALWGGNCVAIKAALPGLPPIALAAARFVLGGTVVWCAARIAGVPIRMQRSQAGRLGGLGVLFVVQIILLNVGTRYTLASRSTVLISTYPFFVALFAHWLIAGDRLTVARVLGLALSFAGVVLIFAEGILTLETSYLLGDVLVLVSGLLLGLRQVVTKRLIVGVHPFAVLFWQAALSLPAFVLLSLLLEGDQRWALTGPVLAGVLYQGLVVAGFCFILYVSLLRRHSASRLGAFGFATPVFGVVLSAVLLDEPVSPVLLLSTALVAAGILVVNGLSARGDRSSSVAADGAASSRSGRG